MAEITKHEEIDGDFWHKVSLNLMNEAWENQEEDIWEEVYKQQKQNGKLIPISTTGKP